MKSKEARPIVTYAIICITTLIMLYLSLISQQSSRFLYDEYSLNPSYLSRTMRITGFISYMFLHADWEHLIVNCFALLCIGSIIEKEVGSSKFLIVYLASGFISGLTHVLLNTKSIIPLVGASGAIFGVLATMFLLTPFNLTPIFFVPLPAVLVGILMVSIEIAALTLSKDPWVAHDAHLAGFIAGGFSAFIIDKKMAIKGLLTAVLVLIVIYILGLFLGVI